MEFSAPIEVYCQAHTDVAPTGKPTFFRLHVFGRGIGVDIEKMRCPKCKSSKHLRWQLSVSVAKD